jgi:hypothetical protein
MVLENDSWSENPPPSDDDAYSGNSAKVNVDTTGFPRPMPIFGKLFGYNEKVLAQGISARVQNLVNVLQRRPNNDEVNAIAFWTAKQISIMSYGPPIGVAAAFWRSWKTADTFRFPFYQANMETFQKEVFPHAQVAMLRGGRAVAAWHIARTICYGICGNWFGKMFFANYSVSVVAVGEMSDKRLKPYHDGLRKQAEQKRGGLLEAPGQRPGQQKPPVPESPQTQDDASPTGGMFGEAEPESPQQQPQWKPLPQSRPTPVPVKARAPEPQSQPFDVFGDDSPSPAQQGAVPDTQAPQQPQGSAWERIRRGERPAGAGGWDNVRKTQGPGQSEWSRQQGQEQREQRQGSTFGERYSISKTEEESSYAKAEAQREFDARVERERRGGDFGGNQKRW